MDWGIVVGFIAIFLTILKGYGDFSKQLGEIKASQDSIMETYKAEKADRQRVEDQLERQITLCKEDHTKRLDKLEKVVTEKTN